MAVINKLKGDTYPVPHESGQFIEIRPLTWQEVKEAREKVTSETRAGAMEMMTIMSPDTIASLKDEGKSKDKDPDDEYDRGIVLRYAVVAWSYPESLTDCGVGDLDEKTARWAFEVAVGLFKKDEEQGE